MKRLFLSLSLFLFILLLPSIASAAVYYVDYSGSHASGTLIAPWKYCPGDTRFTGTYTADTTNGDTFIFKGGVTYTIDATTGIVPANSGASDTKRIIYDGDSGTYAARWGSGTDKGKIDVNQYTYAFKVSSKNYITINNFEIYNSHGGTKSTRTSPVYFQNSDFAVVSNCKLHDCGSSLLPSGRCIYLNGDGGPNDYAEIFNNEIYDAYYDGIFTYRGGHNKIYHNTIHGGIGWGIAVTSPSDGNEIYNNTFTDITPNPAVHNDPIWIYSSASGSMTGMKIYNNLYYFSSDWDEIGQTVAAMSAVISIQNDPGGYDWSGIQIFNNVIVNPWTSDGAIRISSMSGNINNSEVYNNSIWTEHSSGIRIVASGSYGTQNNVKIKGNIVYNINSGEHGDMQLAIALPDDMTKCSNPQVDNNNYYTKTSNNFYYGGSSHTWAQWQPAGYDTHSLGPSSDPKYTNASQSTHDVTLQATSPCIDTFPTGQAPTNLFTADITGLFRPQGLAWDIGAYEYAAAQPPPDTTPPSAPTGLTVL